MINGPHRKVACPLLPLPPGHDSSIPEMSNFHSHPGTARGLPKDNYGDNREIKKPFFKSDRLQKKLIYWDCHIFTNRADDAVLLMPLGIPKRGKKDIKNITPPFPPPSGDCVIIRHAREGGVPELEIFNNF
jgi:hypothetical protein